jgi:GTP-binding protein EngB required for normal cell division
MARSAQELQDDLSRVQALLHQGAFLSLSGVEKERLLEDSIKLVRKLDAVAESSLVVGLLGGTGVGKSSLMNALACAPIAATSHRRPHTNKVLIYHHAATALPDTLVKTSHPHREITHEADAVRHILLCDLPDFDSLLAEHREQVLQFLEHLDILVWVATPEKYADEKFYTFLRQVPKARQNFYFILNKIDLLFRNGEPGTGHSQLTTVMARFSQHLRDNGISQPIIYAVSAREGCDASSASPWNHLWSFHHQIFRLRDAKEVREIKSANLDIEVKQLTEVLEKEVFLLDILHGVLKDSVSDLQSRRSEWSRLGHDAFKRALERNPEEFLHQPAHPRALVGIGYGIAVAAKDWKRLTERAGGRPNGFDLLLEQGTLQALQHELEQVEHRMVYQALHRGLPSSIGDYGAVLFDAATEWNKLLKRLQSVVTQSLDIHWAPTFRGFRAVQYASYLVLLVFLLLAMTGDAGLQNLFERPSWYGLVGLASALVRTLFSPKGFAALGSYAVLQTFLGFRFYGRYKKLLQRHAQKFIESLKLEMVRIWEEELNLLVEHFTQKTQQVEGRSEVLCALRSFGTED